MASSCSIPKVNSDVMSNLGADNQLMGSNALSYRTLLLRISENITASDLEKLKFLCLDFIPDGELETIDSALKLFKALERRSKLAENDLTFLCYLLTNVNCLRLSQAIGDFVTRRELESLGLKTQMGRKEKQGLLSTFSRSGARDEHAGNADANPVGAHIGLKVVLKLASVGAWFAGTAFILKTYINDPETLVQLFHQVVLPSGVLLKHICEGSIICILQIIDLHGLHTLWQNFESGLLKKNLEYVFLTEDLYKLAKGAEIIMDVFLEEKVYRDLCLELILNQEKDKVYKVASCKPRRFSYPMVDYLGKDESVFQEESLRILANTERKRRMEAEKKLEKLLSVHQLDRLLVFNELLQVQNTKDVTDDSSSTSSTSLDEEEVLDWEDDSNPSGEFWSSVHGGIKEKSWTNFEAAIRRDFRKVLEEAGPALLKFLKYVLKVDDKREPQNVSLRNFVRASRWFGPFGLGLQDNCLTKMNDLMKQSASVGLDGKMTSWFAGHITEEEAKEKLRNKKPGTFLIRFNTSIVTPGFVLSRKSRNVDNVVEIDIQVHKDTGHVEFADRTFPSLPSLVTELQNSWMTDLQPFYLSADITMEASLAHRTESP
ncbi:uncharacterized protein [Montipora foliosa]|uniref:uncharacterized protein isoform X2 n=1 Tax=Montipora foliosa TaxID=591990 RepID=UPI0035F1F37E